MEEKTPKKRERKSRVKKEQEVYTDLEPIVNKWRFKNVNRKILLSNSVISNYDLLNNQGLAEILIEKGLGDLICFE